MKVLMVGPDRSVHGGISGVVNNWYEAGIENLVNMEYIGTMKEGTKLKKLMVAVCAYFKFAMKVSKCDVVHVHVASDSSYVRKSYFIKKAYAKKKAIVIHQHGGDIVNYYSNLDSSAKSRMENVFGMADAIVALSESSKEFLLQLVNDVPIFILPNCVSIPNASVYKDKDYSKPNVLFLGRICKDKGIRELVEAFDRLRSLFPQATLSIGGIYEDSDLKQLIEERSEYINYFGWVEGNRKENLLIDNTVLILPSYYEGFPVCILDAMAYGLCVVATEVGGVGEVIENNVNGVLIEPKDVNSLFEGLKYVLQNSDVIKQMAVNGRKSVEDRFSTTMVLSKLYNIYESIIKE